MKGGFMETMLARNMTATFIGYNYDSSLREVNVTGVNPISGLTETKPLGQFINDFMIAQSDQGLGLSDIRMKRQVKALQRQAQKYFKTGKDALGENAIKLDTIERLPGSENFERFAAARSNKAEFLGSYDIHSSLNKYVETWTRKSAWIYLHRCDVRCATNRWCYIVQFIQGQSKRRKMG
jgi:hypothetical protein